MVIAICVSPASSSRGKLFLTVFDCHCHFHNSRFLVFLCCFLCPGRDFVSLSHRAFRRRAGNTCAVYYLDQPGVWKRWKQSLPEQEVRNVVAAAATLLSHTRVFREEDGQWKEEQKLEAHSDWVRDVAWAPSIGLPTSTIASCSQVRPLSERHLLCVVLYACLALAIVRAQALCRVERQPVQTHPGFMPSDDLKRSSKCSQGCCFCAVTGVQPARSPCFCRMAECLSGRAMMPLETHGHQSCCTSSTMLSGMWVGPLLQISLQCLEETTKWVLGLAVLLHAISMLGALLVKTVVGSPLLQWWMFFLFDLSRGEEDPNLWHTSCTAFLLLAGNEKCRLNFIL